MTRTLKSSGRIPRRQHPQDRGTVHIGLWGLFDSEVFFEPHADSNLALPLESQLVPFKITSVHLHASASRKLGH